MTYSVNLNEYTVIKKNGSEEQFDINKVVEACRMAASNCSKKLSLSDENGVASIVTSKVLGLKKKSISTEKIHGWAIQALKIIDQEVADCYKSYHQFRKNTMREVAKIKEKSDHLKYAGDRENANYNSSLFSTQNAIFRGWNSTLISKNFFLTKKERQAIKDGFIYIHDLRDIMVGNHNCCVFDMETVLDGGFKILNVRTEEPKRVMSACGAMYDILNTASAQQYGGFSVPEIDKIVAKYAIKEFQHTGDKDGVLENIKQGLQSLQHHINSNVSARGDTPFITFSFGCIDGEDELFNEFQLAACLELLRYRQKVEMTFPKLVCLYSTPIMEKYPILLDECIETNRTTLYPDYVSLDEGYSGELYKKYKLCHTPMGCRSFPTPLGGYGNPQKTVGLFNVGVVSLNLPLIYMECSKKKLDFIEEVKKYTQMCIDFLDRRYEQIASMKCSSNPLGFCEGGFVGGNKNPDDLVGDIVNNMGASIGITALNELSVLRNGCELHFCDEEGYRNIVEVVEAIKELVNKNCSNERHYSLYGTPAESLCGTQCAQFKKRFGIVEGVSDKPYFNNSFHMPVTADISPIEKMNLEYELFHIINGGHIQYVRVDEPENKQAIKKLVKYGMKKGFYQGININCISCEDCGEHFRKHPTVCPKCGSKNILEVGRVCGYKGFMNRMNDAKLAEIAERKCM